MGEWVEEIMFLGIYTVPACLSKLSQWTTMQHTHTHTHTHKAAITGVVLIIRVPRRCSRLFVLSLDILLEAGQHKREPFCYLQERLSWISVFIASAELVVWCFISQAPCKPMNIIMVFTHAPTATSMVAALQANMSNSIRN